MSLRARSKPPRLEDLQKFAGARGGVCLSTESGGFEALHRWRCARGHLFEARPAVLMDGGYWCNACQPSLEAPGPWDWSVIAEGDPTIARFHLHGGQGPEDPTP